MTSAKNNRKVFVKAPDVGLVASSGFPFGDRREWEVKLAASQRSETPVTLAEK